MQDTHEPRDEFVESLEWQLRHDVRRRNRSARGSRWMWLSPVRSPLAVVGLMLLSMGIGAVAVAAAYRAQGSEYRDRLSSSVERRIEVARQRLASVTEQLRATERRLSLGTASQEERLERRVAVAEASAALKSLELQLEEIRITGREPLNEASSPLVSGRDFVSEQLRIEMSVPEAALDLERSRLRETEKRLSVGTADVIDVEAARARLVEIEVAVEAFRTKVEIRQKLLSHTIDAVEAELRVLEGEAEQRRKTLAPKVDVARKRFERARSNVQIGTAQRVDVAEATLRLQELETEMAKTELDLALTRRQLEQRRSGR